MMKYFSLSTLRYPSLTSWLILPGVPQMMWGGVSPLRSFLSSFTGRPPMKVAVRMFFRYFPNLLNSFSIWKAISLVLAKISVEIGYGFSLSSVCSTVSTKTAVLPIPDLAWQMISAPSRAVGIHCYYTVVIKIFLNVSRTFWWILESCFLDRSGDFCLEKHGVETAGVVHFGSIINVFNC